MFTISISPERPVNHRYQVLQHHPVKRGTIQSSLLIHILPFARNERSFHIPTVHHNKHRHTLPGGYQVIHNMLHTSLCRPARLILAHAMLQVKYRITFFHLGFIFSRSIDHATAEFLFGFRIISTRAHLPMRYSLLRTIVITFHSLGNLYPTRHTATTKESVTGRIGHLHPVRYQKIIMESYDQRIGLYCPEAIRVLLHVILLTATVHLKPSGLRSIKTEVGATLLVQPRILVTRNVGRCGLRPVFHLLLCHFLPAEFPPVKMKQFTSFPAFEHKIDIMHTRHRNRYIRLYTCPTFPSSGMRNPHFSYQRPADAVGPNFYPPATKGTGNRHTKTLGRQIFKIHLAYLYIIPVMNSGYIHPRLCIPFRFYSFGESYRFRLHTLIRSQCAYRRHPFCRRINYRESTIGVVTELLHCHATSETTPTG